MHRAPVTALALFVASPAFAADPFVDAYLRVMGCPPTAEHPATLELVQQGWLQSQDGSLGADAAAPFLGAVADATSDRVLTPAEAGAIRSAATFSARKTKKINPLAMATQAQQLAAFGQAVAQAQLAAAQAVTAHAETSTTVATADIAQLETALGAWTDPTTLKGRIEAHGWTKVSCRAESEGGAVYCGATKGSVYAEVSLDRYATAEEAAFSQTNADVHGIVVAIAGRRTLLVYAEDVAAATALRDKVAASADALAPLASPEALKARVTAAGHTVAGCDEFVDDLETDITCELSHQGREAGFVGLVVPKTPTGSPGKGVDAGAAYLESATHQLSVQVGDETSAQALLDALLADARGR